MSIWVLRGFRLAFIVGLFVGTYDAFNNFKLYSEAEQRNSETRSMYECVERIPDELAKIHMNEYGNINAKALGCSIRESWAGSNEIADMRLGKLELGNTVKPFILESTLLSVILGFLATTIIVTVIISVVLLSRWIWGSKL